MASKIKIDKDFLIREYIDNNRNITDIASELGINRDTVRARLKDYNMLRKSYNSKNVVSDKKVIIEKDKDLDFLRKKGYNLEDIVNLAKGLEKQTQMNSKPYFIGKKRVKFILFGDTHIGNIHYDAELMKLVAKVAKSEKVDFVANTGDIFDGWYQNRPASIFEQNAIGFDRQMNMAVEEFSQIDAPLYFITGNHSYNTFVRGAGIEAGPVFESRLKEKGMEAHYLGNANGDIYIGETLLSLMHPDGGSSYAISYKSQKITESLESGKKPNILAIGHFHKAEYLFYRNVHIFQTATLMGQTKFMKGKGLAAHKGFWLVDLITKDDGQIDAITPRLYASYK